MKALLLIAHGSRRKQSNDEVVELADTLKRTCSEHYPIIHAGFLEIAETLIPDGIRKCVEDGATSIIVLPYFLNSGNHVTEDIPKIVQKPTIQPPLRGSSSGSTDKHSAPVSSNMRAKPN